MTIPSFIYICKASPCKAGDALRYRAWRGKLHYRIELYRADFLTGPAFNAFCLIDDLCFTWFTFNRFGGADQYAMLTTPVTLVGKNIIGDKILAYQCRTSLFDDMRFPFVPEVANSGKGRIWRRFAQATERAFFYVLA